MLALAAGWLVSVRIVLIMMAVVSIVSRKRNRRILNDSQITIRW